ncbi:IS110 family transposase [Mycolicibacterium sp. TY66]|uniref:IS110 family transposase n=1 Tax=Mycolicibacterium sp. TY66 TaxID=2755560 RepID=UPI001FD2E4B2|nr:IS110 family transposase [Mycolicibacterium sp. TY66]
MRAYTGLVPKVSQSGVGKVESSITKAGDPLLREMLCTAADQARKVDPQIAAKYQRLMAGDRHHDSAICHLATLLVTRIATCMRAASPTPYAMSTAPPSPKLRAACSSKSATRLSRAAETTSGTTVCATAANRGRARSHRSRRTLQHPGPPPITLRANTSLDIR